MSNKPIRHKTHVLEAESERFVKNLLPITWITDKPTDYGIDLKVEIAEDNELTGHNFSIQLKSKEKDTNKEHTSIVLKKSTINYYLARLEPILIICYIQSEREAYYTWVTSALFDLTEDKKTYSVKINKNNKVSILNWNEIKTYVSKIFNNKFLLEEFPGFDNPNNANNSEKKAWKLFFSQKYEKSIHEFTSINGYESNPAILNSLAMCHYNLYRYKEALITINKALDIAESRQLLENKASILAEYGITTTDRAKLLEAEKIFKSSIKSNPSASLYYNYANTLSQLKKYRKAKENYKISLSLNPNNAEAWKNLGQVYCDTDEIEQGIKYFNKALIINPILSQALISKGIIYASSYENYQEALSYIFKAIEADNNVIYNFEQTYFWIAYCYHKLKNKVLTIKYIDIGLNNNPSNMNLLMLKHDYHSEHWQHTNQDRYEAKKFFKKSINIFADDFRSLSKLCLIYLYENKKEKVYKTINGYHANTININTDVFNKLSIDINDYIKSIEYNQEYLNYISLLSNRYINIAHEQNLTLNKLFKEHLDFGIKFSFCITIDYLIKSKFNIKDTIKFNRNTLQRVLPKIAEYYITASTDNTDLLIEQMTKVSLYITQVSLSETGRTFGYFVNRFPLDKTSMNTELNSTKESNWFTDTLIDSIENINKKFNIFKES